MFTSIRAGSPRSALTVVAVTQDSETLPRGLEVDAAAKRRLKEALGTPGFTGELGSTLPVGGDLLLLGAGERDAFDGDAARKLGARLVKALDQRGDRNVRLLLTAALPKATIDPQSLGQAIGEGLALANWRVDFFDGSATKNAPAHGGLTVGAEKDVQKGLQAGLELAECVNEARRLAVTPPNIANPPWMAKEARRLAKAAGLTCRVISTAEAERLGMGGIVNVGKGSDQKPCLIILEHKPTRAKKGVKLALVGKTMTYDTGGYSLKLSGGMKGMKYDGNGGCAVLGAMLAIAKRKVPVHVVALLPCAENMVSGDSYRPDDIITMYNGTSVEVTNTDAEGRLILADALAYACAKIKPTAIVDMATLTGGVVVALGEWCAGVFCNDDDLLGRLQTSADDTGERIWRLPLWEDHRTFMRAKHADLWNSGPKRDGHPIQGAAFLSFFVDEKIPWAHVDIAGVSATQSDQDLAVTGPTGYGVRLLTDLAGGYSR